MSITSVVKADWGRSTAPNATCGFDIFPPCTSNFAANITHNGCIGEKSCNVNVWYVVLGGMDCSWQLMMESFDLTFVSFDRPLP